MSDALTDIANDDHRSGLFDEYLNAVCQFIDNPTDGNLKNAAEAARNVDDFKRGGYWSGRTHISAGIEGALIKLKEGDRRTWACLLYQAWGRTAFQRLKKASPYKDGIISFVNYGRGFVNIGGELDQLINQFIRDRGFKTYDCDKYLVVLPKIDSADDIGVEWFYCGIRGVNGPRIRLD